MRSNKMKAVDTQAIKDLLRKAKDSFYIDI